MKTGISTASLFCRYSTEDALQFLAESKVQNAEVFLESYCEYKPEFGNLLKSRMGNINVHSVHTLTTQFEPTLYSVNERAMADSHSLLRETMSTAREIGAEYYTFHGGARMKRTPLVLDFDRVARCTQKVIDICSEYDVKLAYENVHWCYYNYVGFFKEVSKRTSGLKGTLDIKQARQSGVDYREFLKEMGKDIVTVHLSDIKSDGKMCLPGRGETDFYEMFGRLSDVGFDGALLLEVYQGDYVKEEELFESLEFINDTAKRVW